MSFSNIIGGLLANGMSGQSHNRLRTGAENADRSGGIDQMLDSFLGGGSAAGSAPGTKRTGGGGFADMARDFLSKPQAGGMSGAKIGGIGALVGGLLGGGLGGAAKGGVMAILGTLALQALRGEEPGTGAAAGTARGAATGTGPATGKAMPAEAGGAAGSAGRAGAGATPAARPTPDQVRALTDESTERLVLRSMIGAAQVDGHVSDAEMEKMLGGMNEGDVTEEERRTVRAEVARPVDVEAIGREVSRPEVAAQIYLATLMAVDVDTEAERDYFRRLARALKLEPGVVGRLHGMTGAPTV